ncbi:MAG: putative Fe-S cluster assembly protein SufT [Gammaproteobacteria bacterium]|nr:putative Fe-S cluster assembly protein SufT [Gammaproteobacteria bacterium]
MSNAEVIKLKRDITATEVPFGNSITIPSGTEVSITQSLGGTFTAICNGQMIRIESKDADALGKEQTLFMPATSEAEDSSIEDKIWAQLKTCYDPEIPVDIVDLGLIYGIDLEKVPNETSYNVVIRMTLTAPGCGMGPMIAADAHDKVASLPQVKNVEIKLVFDPPWDRSMMSEQAKLELGLL